MLIKSCSPLFRGKQRCLRGSDPCQFFYDCSNGVSKDSFVALIRCVSESQEQRNCLDDSFFELCVIHFENLFGETLRELSLCLSTLQK